MSLDEGISRLIGRIYESAHDTDQWEATLEDVRQRLGVRCLFQSVSRLDGLEMRRGLVLGEPKRPQGMSEYLETQASLDPSFRWAAKNPRARFCSTDKIIASESYLDNEYIRWARDEFIGSTHWIVGYTQPNDQLTFGLSVHPFEGPLTSSNKTLFRLLFDHMERAARLAVVPRQLFSGEEALIVLDATGCVRQLSPKADAIVSLADGLVIRSNRVSASHPEDARALSETIMASLNAGVTGSYVDACFIRRPSRQEPYLVTSSPLPRGTGPFADFSAAVLLRVAAAGSARAVSATARLARMFGLTRREVEVGESLMLGHSLDSASETLGISRNTIRVHLQALFRKTGTNRQSELIRLMIDVSR